MNRRTPAHRTDDVPGGDGHRPAWYTHSGTLYLAGFGLVVAVGALAYAGGTLTITEAGVTLAVNARS